MGRKLGLGSDPFGVDGLLEGARTAVAVDPVSECDEVLMASVVALEDARALLEAAEVRVLGRLEATGATDAAVGMRTGRWLAWETDTRPSDCNARVRTARVLSWFDEFAEAIAQRRVRLAHAEVLASVANRRNREGLVLAQGALVDLAAEFDLDRWSQLVRQLAIELDADGSYDPNEDPDAQRLRVTGHHDGTADVKGVLNGSGAVTVTQTLEAVADELFRRYRRDAEQDPSLEMPCRARLMAEALAEVCCRAGAVDLGSSRKPGVEATVVIEHDPTADVLEELRGEAVGPSVGPRPPASIRCRDLEGRPVPPSTAEQLLVDPVVRGLLVDGDGVPLYLGERVRFVTADQKTALAVRDGGCVFPGCDMPPDWCDAHHQPGWVEGGRTDIDKMFLACRHHHRVTHRQGWRCDPDPQRAQQWTWTTPAGRTLHSQRQHRRASG